MLNEKAQEDIRDIFTNLEATRGKEFAQVVMLTCRAHAVVGMVTNLQCAHDWMKAETAQCAARTFDALISSLVDVHSFDPKEIVQWAELIQTKGNAPTTH